MQLEALNGTMTEQNETYWQHRIMRHKTSQGSVYAIHEVYFSDSGRKIDGYTLDALSEKFETIELLKISLQSFLDSSEEFLVCGEKQYKYFKSDVEQWLQSVEKEIVEYVP